MSILALTSDTLIGTPAAGNLEYNGQFFGTDSAGSRAQLQRLVLSTAQATTSGTSKDFTSIPAWVKRITVMFQGVSTNGGSVVQFQLGTSSGVITTGYLGSGMNAATVVASSNYTSGFGTAASGQPASTIVLHGQIIISNISSNNWVASGIFGRSDGAGIFFSGGSIALGGTLDRVRITTVNGTDTFDAGSVNIMYEG
jgi:hypothetical protein